MSSVIEYEIHPVAEMFPLMSDAECKALADDIREEGLNEKIWVRDGKIIDGRNRYLACREHGIPLGPEHFREWSGKGSLVNFVCSQNLHRRHLTASQKAFVGAEAKKKRQEEMTAGRPKNNSGKNSGISRGRESRDEAAAMVGVNPRYISDAERVQEASPETAAACLRGEKTLSQAKKELGIGQPKAKPEAKPEPQPAPTGQSRVNGVLVDDPPRIARLRAAGKMHPDVIPDITDPGVTTTVEMIREEMEERLAIQNDLSDEDWLAKLPLSLELPEEHLKVFRADALAYRALEQARAEYKRCLGEVLDKTRKLGPFLRAEKKLMSRLHPKDWIICIPATEGGCGGSGKIPGFKEACPECYGHGYLIS